MQDPNTQSPPARGHGPVSRTTLTGIGAAIVAFFVYWVTDHKFDTGRGDFFYLADSFLHGRTWIAVILGHFDYINVDGRIYLPFAPFPAVVLAPLVAITGPVTADQLEPVINAFLAASVVGLAWWVAGRIGVVRLGDRLMLVLLLGFSTPIWWITIRGGVWHTGQLIATILVLLMIAELFGRKRALVLGLLLGAAFLSRAPLALAAPAIAWWLTPAGAPDGGRSATLDQRVRALPWRDWIVFALGVAPAVAFFFWYNADRFGSPFESGYALATLPEWLEQQRRLGLFSLAHVPMNLDYLLLKVPALISTFPFFRPDGLGMSVLITSPGLLLAVRAPWADRRSRLLLAAAALVLIPTLLYYGGGWIQFGYRYFLDSIPFLWALVAMGVVHRGSFSGWQRALIWFGVVLGALSVLWAYNFTPEAWRL